MMFLAIALSCDDTLTGNPRRGIQGCLVGLAFAVAVTEVVLRTIRLRLPGWYRAAYYAILGLVFLYPVALVPLLGDPDNPALQWALFAFSPMAALARVAADPGGRRGRAGVAGNGSPWPWPLYPWSLFVVMVGALCVRSWSLCVSFHYVTGSRSIFGTYFLVPIGMAVALVWLEIGIAARRKGIMIAASVVPLVLACLAVAQPPGTGSTSSSWSASSTRSADRRPTSPALAAVAFLAYAASGACRGPGPDGPRAGRAGRGRSADGLLRQPGGPAGGADGRGGSRARRGWRGGTRFPQGPPLGRLPRGRRRPAAPSISGRRDPGRRPSPGRAGAHGRGRCSTTVAGRWPGASARPPCCHGARAVAGSHRSWRDAGGLIAWYPLLIAASRPGGFGLHRARPALLRAGGVQPGGLAGSLGHADLSPAPQGRRRPRPDRLGHAVLRRSPWRSA